MEYRKVDNTVIDDVAQYLKATLQAVPASTIYVGTDSQNKVEHTVYATAIVVHWNTNNGGHVVYTMDKVPYVKNKFDRLWGEVQRSVDVALFLRDECQLPVHFVDLDLNANVKWDSNKVLKPAIGYVESLGFQVRYKPGPAYAVRMADALCR